MHGMTASFESLRETVRALVVDGSAGSALAVLVCVILAWLVVSFIRRRSRASARREAELSAASGDEASKVVEEQYQALLHSSPLPTFICDTRKWRLLEVNEAAAREYGYTREELLKMTLGELGLPEQAE